MDWSAQVDNYCERLAPGFWGEPINAFTNLAFLIAAIIIYWNTKQLGEVVQRMTKAKNPPDPALLPHVSPLGWERINLTGEYHWPQA